jgi:hypothetical protein
MRFALAPVVMVVLLAIGGVASAQVNDSTTVVLHVEAGFATGCTTVAGVDCATVPPTVRVDGPSGPYSMFMFCRNYDDLKGIQVAFQWPAGWTLTFGNWTCQTNPLSLQTPANPGGPADGSLVTSFDPVLGGDLTMIGFMAFGDISSGGCLEIVDTTAPGGNATIDTGLNIYDINPDNEGSICVDQDGLDTCTPVATPVEPATWGKIKASYGR